MVSDDPIVVTSRTFEPVSNSSSELTSTRYSAAPGRSDQEKRGSKISSSLRTSSTVGVMVEGQAHSKEDVTEREPVLPRAS